MGKHLDFVFLYCAYHNELLKILILPRTFLYWLIRSWVVIDLFFSEKDGSLYHSAMISWKNSICNKDHDTEKNTRSKQTEKWEETHCILFIVAQLIVRLEQNLSCLMVLIENFVAAKFQNNFREIFFSFHEIVNISSLI